MYHPLLDWVSSQSVFLLGGRCGRRRLLASKTEQGKAPPEAHLTRVSIVLEIA
jgi:hypothetical protein